MLHVDPKFGMLKVIGCCLCMHSCRILKMYDVMALLAVFRVIDLSYVFK